MKKNNIRLLVLILGAALMLSACSVASQPQESSANGLTTEKQEVVEQEEPTKLTMFYQEAGQVYPDGFDHNDNWFFN